MIVKLSNGEAQIDEADYKLVGQYKWHKQKNGYAVASKLVNGRMTSIYMHRLIMNPGSNMVVDHKNEDKLDNRQDNLRVCTHSQNIAYVSVRKSNTSGFTGVGWHKGKGKWRARMTVNYKDILIGYFNTKEEAIVARLAENSRVRGEFAYLMEHPGSK